MWESILYGLEIMVMSKWTYIILGALLVIWLLFRQYGSDVPIPTTRPTTGPAPTPATETVQPDTNRFATFAFGLALSGILYGVGYRLIESVYDTVYLPHTLALLFSAFVIFMQGVTRVAGRPLGGPADQTPPPPVQTEGFVGIIRVLESPVRWKILQWLLPNGKVWLPPWLMDVRAVFVAPYSIQVPAESAKINKDDQHFTVPCITDIPVDPGDPTSETRMSLMLMQFRVVIEKKVVDPYLWVNRVPGEIEQRQVNLILQKIRGVATQSEYRRVNGRVAFRIKTPYDLMKLQSQLGDALEEDMRTISGPEYGEEIHDIIVPHLQPADREILNILQSMAREIAQEAAQTVEGRHYVRRAKDFVEQSGDKISFEDALIFIMVQDGKIDLKKIVTKGKGGLLNILSEAA